MTEKQMFELALLCFDGDERKANALLKLLQLQELPKCKFPEVIMQIDE